MIQKPAKDLVGAVGVHVHLEVGMHAHHEVAVAHRGQKLLRRVRVHVVGMDEELGAVAVRRSLPVVDLLDLDLGSGAAGEREFVAERPLPARERRSERVEEDGQAEASRIHHAVLLQHGQQVGRALDRGVGLLHHGGKRLFRRELLLARALGRRGAVAQHGEDGALHRLAHGLERHLDGRGERRVDAGGVKLLADAALAQAAQNLRGDDTGVAARAHERPGRDRLANFSPLGPDGQLGQVLDDRLQRQRHVRARVAIGNREDVEAVDLVFSLAQGLARRSYGIEKVV